MIAPLVVAYGGGVNSTAMLIGMRQRGIVPNLILMANTGGEKPATLRWLSTFGAWLRDNGLPVLKIVQVRGVDPTLESACLKLKQLPSLAYGFKTCSQRWKAAPQDKFVNHWPPAIDCWASGGRVRKAIGYDADEGRRANSGGRQDDKYTYEYPLIEWGWGRDDCVKVIAEAGLPIPPKSSCFFCPAMRREEVLALKRDEPELFARAVAMERNAELTTVRGLGRNWSWEALGKADDEQMSFAGFTDPQDEPCGCYDGDYDGIDQSVVELSVSAGCKKKGLR